jgi:hypothetical protein
VVNLAIPARTAFFISTSPTTSLPWCQTKTKFSGKCNFILTFIPTKLAPVQMDF